VQKAHPEEYAELEGNAVIKEFSTSTGRSDMRPNLVFSTKAVQVHGILDFCYCKPITVYYRE